MNYRYVCIYRLNKIGKSCHKQRLPDTTIQTWILKCALSCRHGGREQTNKTTKWQSMLYYK